MIDSTIIKHLWAIVEATQEEALINLNENDLVNQLSLKVRQKQILNQQQTEALKEYLYAHTSLIRDLADSRLLQ